MTTYGLTDNGLVIKRLADIKGELEADLKATFGQGFSLASESPEGQFVGIFAERESLIWQLVEDVYNAAYPDTASGVPLDNAVALSGIKRKLATKSTAAVTLFGTAGTVIPAGKIISVSGNAAARFDLDADVTIADPIIEVQRVTFDHIPTGGAWRITYNGLQTGSLAYNANAAAVQTALRLLSGLAAVTVAGDYTSGFTVTYSGALGDLPQATITSSTLTYASGSVVATFATLTPGVPAQGSGTVTAETAGATLAPAGTLTVIETPVAGWTSVTNALDAVIGQNIETDAALKLRRSQSAQKAGTGTVDAIRADVLQLPNVTACLIFENNTSATVSGRPAKSFETVVLGGDDATIAQTIWDDKPAGIQPYGTTIVSVNDSQGFPHDVGFSRPAVVPIYVSVALTTDSTYPVGGNALVQAAIVSYGASLSIGDDVIVYPALMAKLAAIPGIIGVTLKVGTAPSPTLDANIIIPVSSQAVFDTSRVVVTP